MLKLLYWLTISFLYWWWNGPQKTKTANKIRRNKQRAWAEFKKF